MIRDTKILVAAASRGFGHDFERVDAVGALRMRMKDSGNIGIGYKLGQRSRERIDCSQRPKSNFRLADREIPVGRIGIESDGRLGGLDRFRELLREHQR